MRKYRIALIQTSSVFGVKVFRYAVQVRVALFWWVTVETCGQLRQARYWLNHSGAPKRKERVIKILNSTKS